jgi:selenocysteine-specific elongation factor
VLRADLTALGVEGDENGVLVVGDWLVDPTTWAAWTTALATAVDDHARAAPLEAGLPAEAARRAVGLPDVRLLGPLVGAAGLEAVAGRVRRPGAVPAVAPGVVALEQRLAAAPFDAPEQDELDALGLGPRELAAAATAGRLLRLGPAAGPVVLLPDAPARAMRVLAALPQPFTLSAARQALGTTRRVAVPLLEHTDGRGWTRRLDGALRQVVR